MTSHDCGCGCGATPCGCGGDARVAGADNRPGLPALRYRTGTHGRFLAAMRARLPTLEIEVPAVAGQPPQQLRPLQALTTRDPADPALALLDAWASVADVLTFYQERIANEGYVRTATERRSLVELSRLVGYAPRPGVSASVHLSYRVDDNQADAVEIAAGNRAQSIPGADELPQSFETDEPLLARREWNDLQVRRERPQAIDAATLGLLDRLYVRGADAPVAAGDLLLFRFRDKTDDVAWVRVAQSVRGDFASDRCAIALQPLPAPLLAALPLLMELVAQLGPAAEHDSGTQIARDKARRLLNSLRLGSYVRPLQWPHLIASPNGIEDPEAAALLDRFAERIKQQDDSAASIDDKTATPDGFVGALLQPQQLQPRNALQLRRQLGNAFARGADLQPQLLLDFAPALRDGYYAAWRGSTPPAAASRLHSLHVLQPGEALFGASAPREPRSEKDHVLPMSQWPEWPYAADEESYNGFLARAETRLLHDDPVLAQTPSDKDKDNVKHEAPFQRRLLGVDNVFVGPRSAYGLSAEATGIEFAQDWREIEYGKEGRHDIAALRRTQLFLPKAALQPADAPIDEDVAGQEIELGPLHASLPSGRWVIFEGERADIDGVDGVRASELLMIAGLVHGYDRSLPGDRPHTTLRLATPCAYRYRRGTLRIHGNVVAASHGESRREVLGSGDGRAALQHFALHQAPLTWRPAPTAAGAGSTLKVLVNDVEWREADSLAGLGAQARVFVTRNDDDDRTTVIFGNGRDGARLPSGMENVRAEYRSGLGRGGNVQAGQIALMVTRPLGVKEVVNPLRASGGADRESLALIRENAPRSVVALDRLVSVGDYADFVRMFAGIAKADAVRLSDGARECVHVTIAGVDDMPIDPASDLYRNLLQALRMLGDPGLALQVSPRERIALMLQARVRLLDGHRWEPVAAALRAALLQRFGFEARALGQAALLCEVIATMQAVRGVAWVDVDHFGGVPERSEDPATGARTLVTQDFITDTVHRIVGLADHDTSVPGSAPGGPAERVAAARAAYLHGHLRPAQLAIFAPAVADTLILNQIP